MGLDAAPMTAADAELAALRARCAALEAELAARADDGAAPTRQRSVYRALFEAMDEGFCIIEFIDGPDGPLSDYVHVEANAAYARNAGIPDVVGQKVREMVPGEAASWVARYGEVLRTGEPIRFEQELIATGRYLELSAFRLEPPERNQVAVLFNDISARRQAERALQELAGTLEAQVAQRTRERDQIWNTSIDPICVADAAGRLLRVNPAWSRVLGWPDEELLASSIAALVHEEDRGETAAWTAALARGEVQTAFENRLRCADGSYRWLSWNAVPREGLVFAVVRDITEAKEQTQALLQAEEALRQSQKMEAVGQLTGGLAHDFNNLLTGIMGNLELLELRLTRGEHDVERFVRSAQGAGRRAAALTQRLLAFSRRQTLDPKPTDVNRLVQGLEELLRRTVGLQVEIEIVGAAGLWTANIDAGQLENALLNLCINARDAMPDGGRITIETANKWLDERGAGERDLAPGQYLSICVTDNGTGMSRETIERAFEPFFTTKPIGQGTGLGLSMIYGFARQSGGQVRIYSELGEGTTICIYLPRHFGTPVTAEPAAARSGPVSTQGQTILVVDDEPTIRHLIDEVLDDLGYTVIGAADGAAGLKVLQSGARIDLLVTDVGLPGGMNGRQVADAARSLRPGLQVLFITGYAENAAVGNGHLEPGMELLTKPFTLDALATKVAAMMPPARVRP